jgi:hypothetical protein
MVIARAPGRLRPVHFVLLGVLALGGVLAWGVFVHAPAGPRSARAFDPDRLADLEAEMWQAYYQKQNGHLFATLVKALREQFRYPWARAVRAAYHLARAASMFADSHEGYERVLPDLEHAYRIARDWTGAYFEPSQVARDELAWWVARRDPETWAPDNVGHLISVLYAHFYEAPMGSVERAGLLRARAAALRDAGGPSPDWPAVRGLLRDSYRSLHEGLRSDGR